MAERADQLTIGQVRMALQPLFELVDDKENLQTPLRLRSFADRRCRLVEPAVGGQTRAFAAQGGDYARFGPAGRRLNIDRTDVRRQARNHTGLDERRLAAAR